MKKIILLILVMITFCICVIAETRCNSANNDSKANETSSTSINAELEQSQVDTLGLRANIDSLKAITSGYPELRKRYDDLIKAKHRFDTLLSFPIPPQTMITIVPKTQIILNQRNDRYVEMVDSVRYLTELTKELDSLNVKLPLLIADVDTLKLKREELELRVLKIVYKELLYVRPDWVKLKYAEDVLQILTSKNVAKTVNIQLLPLLTNYRSFFDEFCAIVSEAQNDEHRRKISRKEDFKLEYQQRIKQMEYFKLKHRLGDVQIFYLEGKISEFSSLLETHRPPRGAADFSTLLRELGDSQVIIK